MDSFHDVLREVQFFRIHVKIQIFNVQVQIYLFVIIKFKFIGICDY